GVADQHVHLDAGGVDADQHGNADDDGDCHNRCGDGDVSATDGDRSPADADRGATASERDGAERRRRCSGAHEDIIDARGHQAPQHGRGPVGIGRSSALGIVPERSAPQQRCIRPSPRQAVTTGEAASARVHASAGRTIAPRLSELTWAAWLGAGLVMVLLVSNPLYIGLLLGCALVVYISQRTVATRLFDVLRAGGVVVALAT